MGPELVTNGTFDTDLSGWSFVNGPNGTWSSGRALIADDQTADMYRAVALTEAHTYLFSFDYQLVDSDHPVNNKLNFYLDSVLIQITPTTSLQTYSLQKTIVAPLVLSGFPSITFSYNGSAGATKTGIYIDNITIQEVYGVFPTYATSLVSSVVRVQQNSNTPQFVMGGRNAGTYKLFKKSSSYSFNVWRSQVFSIGRNFDILEIKFGIQPAITSNMSITPVLYFDNEDSSSPATPITSTNYSNSQNLIVLTSKNFSNSVHGRNNFFLELQFTGSALATVELPIEISLEVEELI